MRVCLYVVSGFSLMVVLPNKINRKLVTQVTGFGLPIHPNNNEGNERQQNVITKDEQITKI